MARKLQGLGHRVGNGIWSTHTDLPRNCDGLHFSKGMLSQRGQGPGVWRSLGYTDFFPFMVSCTNPTKANTSANAKGMMASGRQLASSRGLDTAADSKKAFLPAPMARNGSQKSTSHQMDF